MSLRWRPISVVSVLSLTAAWMLGAGLGDAFEIASRVLQDGSVDTSTSIRAVSFDAALAAMSHLAAFVVSAWVAAVGVIAHLGSAGRRMAIALTPRVARAALLAILGSVAVATPALASPSMALVDAADDAGGQVRAHQSGSGVTGLQGLRLPERPISTSAATTSPASIPGNDADMATRRSVTVRVGDSLWLVASRHLGPRGDDVSIAALVTQLHHLNRHVIGSDPDLVLPGTRLLLPQENP